MSAAGPASDVVVELTAEQTHPLRLAVLRFGTPTTDVVFAGDDWPGTVHFGVRRSGVLIAISSWVAQPYLDAPAVQLRGMATVAHLRGTGIGGLLLATGCARCAAALVPTVWARARDSALPFYERHGFVIAGDGFVDDATRLPHHVVVRALSLSP